jgi:hypothetical protein
VISLPKKGYTQTAEHREKIADALRGRPLTKTHRRNISRGVHRHLYEKETRTA